MHFCIYDLFVGEPNNNEWLQFDFTKERIIYGVVTRGRADYAQWVTSYKMLYSSDASQEKTWKTFRDVIGDEMVSLTPARYCKLTLLTHLPRRKVEFPLGGPVSTQLYMDRGCYIWTTA